MTTDDIDFPFSLYVMLVLLDVLSLPNALDGGGCFVFHYLSITDLAYVLTFLVDVYC